jgi:hypothetical protein
MDERSETTFKITQLACIACSRQLERFASLRRRKEAAGAALAGAENYGSPPPPPHSNIAQQTPLLSEKKRSKPPRPRSLSRQSMRAQQDE